ncbi:MAG: hypothetical protein JW747_03010 [Candidatus Aminicenantes bacterium]|nr:hypothetical protein [Candidatus Aminicenantes bacterium]
MTESRGVAGRTENDLKAQGSELCLACGLCCRGVFFVNTIDPEDYGLSPSRRTLPPGTPAPPRCLLHVDNKCLIYDDPRKPVFCSDWQCHLLKQLLRNAVTLESAKDIVAEITRLYERIARFMPPDGSMPVVKQALEVWKNRKEELSAGRLSGAQLLDISSFLRLVDQYLKPYTPGLLRHSRSLPDS